MKQSRLNIIVVFLLFSLAPHLNMFAKAAENTLTVWGEAVIYDGDIPQAKERALQEAFAAAITKVMGTMVSVEGFTRNYESIERSVFGKTKGYIKTYEVIAEKRDGDIQQLQVLVTVSEESLIDDLTALGIMLDAIGNPVVCVLGQEQGLDTAVSIPYFINELAQKGFHVLEANEKDKVGMMIRLNGSIENQTEMHGTGMNGAVVSLSANAYWQGSKKIIVALQKRTNGAGAGEKMALKNGYQRAASNLFPEFLELMTTKWQNEINNGRLISVTVQTESYEMLHKFKRRMSRIFGVKHIDITNFKSGKAEMHVKFAGKTDLFAELITRTDFEGVKEEILDMEQGHLSMIIRTSN